MGLNSQPFQTYDKRTAQKLIVCLKIVLVKYFFIILDIDECAVKSHSCDVNAVCQNTKGSYKCTCKTGFKGDGKKCSGKYTICWTFNFAFVTRTCWYELITWWIILNLDVLFIIIFIGTLMYMQCNLGHKKKTKQTRRKTGWKRKAVKKLLTSRPLPDKFNHDVRNLTAKWTLSSCYLQMMKKGNDSIYLGRGNCPVSLSGLEHFSSHTLKGSVRL